LFSDPHTHKYTVCQNITFLNVKLGVTYGVCPALKGSENIATLRVPE